MATNFNLQGGGQKLMKVDVLGQNMIQLNNIKSEIGGITQKMSTGGRTHKIVIHQQKQPHIKQELQHDIKTMVLPPASSSSSSAHHNTYSNNYNPYQTVQMPPPSPTGSSNGVHKRKKVHKVNKGLRHFSMKVCEKVKQKGLTTYNEVADELVADEIKREKFSDPESQAGSYDQKNIRRRVYDALNVLMAMNIISKEKKEIRWLGLPGNSLAHCSSLDHEIEQKKKNIAAKEKELKDLLMLQVSLKSLVERNRESELAGYIPTPNSHIQLPFIVVNTHKDTHINCSISHDKTEYFFKFDDKFEIHDHVKVLQRMGLLLGLDTGMSNDEDIEKMKKLVPLQFQKLIEHYGRGNDGIDYEVVADDFDAMKEELSDLDEDEDDDDDMAND